MGMRNPNDVRQEEQHPNIAASIRFPEPEHASLGISLHLVHVLLNQYTM
jgi:hypothetical protein